MEIGISNQTPALVGCNSCVMDKTLDEPNNNNNQPLNREQLKDYRDSFFGFRSKLWQPSGQESGSDPVDKINDMINNRDPLKNKKIGDIYDQLNNNNNKCVLMPNIDNINMDGPILN